jgi:hypothetical protein
MIQLLILPLLAVMAVVVIVAVGVEANIMGKVVKGIVNGMANSILEGESHSGPGVKFYKYRHSSSISLHTRPSTGINQFRHTWFHIGTIGHKTTVTNGIQFT